jgi:hypothetical protein
MEDHFAHLWNITMVLFIPVVVVVVVVVVVTGRAVMI